MANVRLFFTIALLLSGQRLALEAQSSPWSHFTLAQGGPTRWGQTVVYDPGSNSLILFGDFIGSPCCTSLNDTWVLRNANGIGGVPQEWQQLFPAGTLPPGRINQSAVYDQAHNRMIIFGGGQANNYLYPVRFNDVWVLANANGLGGTPTWTQLNPAATGGLPAPREGPEAAYDPNTNRMTIFGGGNNGIMDVPNDVWVLTNANGLGGEAQWIQLSPAGNLPARREQFAAAYNPASNVMTIFGGCCPSLNDVWVLSHANGLGGAPAWQQVSPTGTAPAPRGTYDEFGYDPATNSLIIFGGLGFNPGGTEYNDTWLLTNEDNIGGTPAWVNTIPNGSSGSPPPSTPSGAYDAVSKRLMVLPDPTDLWVLATDASTVPSINAGGVTSAASYATTVAPGSIAASFGSFLLGSSAQAQATPLPTSLSGLSLRFRGATKAPLFYVSGNQINFQVPWELAGQSQVPVTVTVDGQTSAPQTANIVLFAPGLFAMNGQGTGQGAILDASYRLVDASNPAMPGSTVLQIFCTGLGPVTNQPPSGSPAPSSPLAETPTTPTVTVGGESANVLFSGLAPGSVGEYQVNALVPATVLAGSAVPVAISIGGAISNTVTIAVQGATGTGTLDIEITGLPAETSANVSITSTSGYTTTVTASASLQVPSGSYNIVASPVAVGNISYNAIAQQSVNVAADSSVTVQEPYTTVIPNTTKVLDQTGASTLTIAADGSTLTMSAQSAVAQSLAPGDVLAGAPTPAAPHGLLRKIVSVNQAAGQVTATTTQAALTDAIQQANVQFSANLLPQNIQSATALRPGVEVRVGRRPTSTGASPAGPRPGMSPMDASDSCANSQIVVTEMKNVEIASGLDVSGEIEVCGNFNIQTNVNWLGLQLNSLTATATFGAHTALSVTGQAAVAEFSATLPVATIQFGDIVVPVGPIPVDVVPEITIQIGASGAIDAAFSAGVSQNASVTGGFSFANGQVSPVLQSTPLTFQLQPLSVTAGLTATVDVEADIDLLFYDVAGPYFKPQAYLQFDANVLQNPWWTLSGGLKGPTGLELNPDLDVLGFDNLPDISFGNLFDVSQTFLQASAGFPSLQGLTPNATPAGSSGVTVTVAGSNFVSGSTVNFNGTPLATAFVSPSELTATVPASDLASSGTFPVTVSNPAPGGGTSAPVNFTVQGASNPQPTITNLSPSSASAGSGPLTLTINGSGFIASSTVTFNGALHAATFVSSGQLNITLTASDLAAVGSFAVVVSNPAPGGGLSNAVAFAVQPVVVAPKLTSLTLSASSVVAGGSVTGTVTLNTAAPAGGVQIPIQDSPAILQVGSSVTVPAGQTTGTFTIGAPAVTSPTTVIITASLVSVSVSARLVINPGTTTNPFQNSTFDIYGTLNISGQSVPVEIQTLALSDGTLGVISNSSGSLIMLTMLFNEQSSVSGNTLTYSGVDPSSSFLNASTSVFYFSFSSATLSLTVQSPTVGAAITGTLQFTSSGTTLSGTITGTINSVSGP